MAPTVFDADGAVIPTLKESAQRIASISASADLLGVVIDVTNPKRPYPTHIIWLGDDSLVAGRNEQQNAIKIAVSLRSKQSKQLTSVGDIVRINHAKLMASNLYAGTRIYHFSVPASDPASDWGVLGKVQLEGGDERRGEFQVDSDIHGAHPPGSMSTHPSCIARLVDWFAQQPRLPHMVPLTCRFCTLSTLQNSSGVTCHTRARVISVQSHSGMPKFNRRRPRQPAVNPMPTKTYALLADPSTQQSNMTFIDLNNQWTELLQSAQWTGKLVLFYFVETKRAQDDTIMLVSTPKTRLVPHSEESNRKMEQFENDCDDIDSWDFVQSQFLMSLTQQSSVSRGMDTHKICSPFNEPGRKMVASIHSLRVCYSLNGFDQQEFIIRKNTELQHHLNLAEQLQKVLSERHVNQGFQGELVLKALHSDDGQRPLLEKVSFSSARILAALFGAFVNNDDDIVFPDTTAASELLKALIDHEVSLYWTLQSTMAKGTTKCDSSIDSSHWSVVDVKQFGEMKI